MGQLPVDVLLRLSCVIDLVDAQTGHSARQSAEIYFFGSVLVVNDLDRLAACHLLDIQLRISRNLREAHRLFQRVKSKG